MLLVVLTIMAAGCVTDDTKYSSHSLDSLVAIRDRTKAAATRIQARRDSVRKAEHDSILIALAPILRRPIVASSLSSSEKRHLINLMWGDTPAATERDRRIKAMNEFERRDGAENVRATFDEKIARAQKAASHAIHTEVLPCETVDEYDFQKQRYIFWVGGIANYTYLHWLPVYPKQDNMQSGLWFTLDKERGGVLEMENAPSFCRLVSYAVDPTRARPV